MFAHINNCDATKYGLDIGNCQRTLRGSIEVLMKWNSDDDGNIDYRRIVNCILTGNMHCSNDDAIASLEALVIPQIIEEAREYE